MMKNLLFKYIGWIMLMCLGFHGWALQPHTLTLHPPTTPNITLTPEQTRVFRQWMIRVIHQQLQKGPSPRWQQRDCAGLVRFAVAESLRSHDASWLLANGITPPTPPEIQLSPQQSTLRHNWFRADGNQSAWVRAHDLIRYNTVFVSKDVMQAREGDLLFYDQGDDQHLMVWMGRYLAYHTGQNNPPDTGLRAYRLNQLYQKADKRWKPSPDNPNFLGVFRFAFLNLSS